MIVNAVRIFAVTGNFWFTVLLRYFAPPRNTADNGAYWEGEGTPISKLAEPRNAAENQAIKDFAMEYKTGVDPWLGLTDIRRSDLGEWRYKST